MEPAGFEPQQRSLLSGDGPWKLEVEIRVEGHVFAGAKYEDSAEEIEVLYRTDCDAPAVKAENERLREAVTLARRRLCRYCADESYVDRGPDSVGVGDDYWHWGIGMGDKPPCDAAEIRRAALKEEEKQ